MTRWTTKEIALTRLMLADGASHDDIARALGRSRSSVRNYVNAHPRQFGAALETVRRSVNSRQLCWNCRLANGSGDCEWANSKCTRPVPGWTATEVSPPASMLARQLGHTPWYSVTACPKYVPDPPKTPVEWLYPED